MLAEINIGRLAQMAKLTLSEAESAEIEKQMEFLAKDFEKLSSIETDGVSPFIYPAGFTNVLREDKAVQKIDKETLLANAPGHVRGYFKVPKTVE